MQCRTSCHETSWQVSETQWDMCNHAVDQIARLDHMYHATNKTVNLSATQVLTDKLLSPNSNAVPTHQQSKWVHKTKSSELGWKKDPFTQAYWCLWGLLLKSVSIYIYVDVKQHIEALVEISFLSVFIQLANFLYHHMLGWVPNNLLGKSFKIAEARIFKAGCLVLHQSIGAKICDCRPTSYTIHIR